MSKIGLSFCILYLALTALFVWGSHDAGSDTKGAFVLLQLPLTFQLGFIDWLGLDQVTDGWSWGVSYAVIVPLTLLFLYYTGWGISRVIRSSRTRSSTNPS
jgi:hypothetical protein